MLIKELTDINFNGEQILELGEKLLVEK